MPSSHADVSLAQPNQLWVGYRCGKLKDAMIEPHLADSLAREMRSIICINGFRPPCNRHDLTHKGLHRGLLVGFREGCSERKPGKVVHNKKDVTGTCSLTGGIDEAHETHTHHVHRTKL